MYCSSARLSLDASDISACIASQACSGEVDSAHSFIKIFPTRRPASITRLTTCATPLRRFLENDAPYREGTLRSER